VSADATGNQPEPSGGDVWLSPRLDTALTGRLPCLVCGYELQGLSIRAVCPECGTAVRATILYQVDPEADEFKPMLTPRWTAWSLVAWSFAGLALLFACWAPRIADLVSMFAMRRPPTGFAAFIALGACILGGVSMLGLVKPSRETPLRRSVGVVIGILAMVPLGWSCWLIQTQIDPTQPAPFVDPAWRPGEARTALRLIFGASAITILLSFRPLARELVRRSLALRTGRVDRQTIFAMVGALLIAALGDIAHLIVAELPGSQRGGGYLETFGTLLIVMGSAFLSLGVVGAAIDGWRVRRAILTPSPSLRQVIGSQPQD
jgi:hypothetical protein